MMHPEAADYEYHMKETKMEKVFVYGTLMSGRGNNRIMSDKCRLLYKASTVKPFVMFGIGFPLARPATSEDSTEYTGRVSGEVWTVDEATLAAMDRLEGHPNFYCRTITDIFPFPKQQIWMYHWVGGSIRGEYHKPTSDRLLIWPFTCPKRTLVA